MYKPSALFSWSGFTTYTHTHTHTVSYMHTLTYICAYMGVHTHVRFLKNPLRKFIVMSHLNLSCYQ